MPAPVMSSGTGAVDGSLRRPRLSNSQASRHAELLSRTELLSGALEQAADLMSRNAEKPTWLEPTLSEVGALQHPSSGTSSQGQPLTRPIIQRRWLAAPLVTASTYEEEKEENEQVAAGSGMSPSRSCSSRTRGSTQPLHEAASRVGLSSAPTARHAISGSAYTTPCARHTRPPLSGSTTAGSRGGTVSSVETGADVGEERFKHTEEELSTRTNSSTTRTGSSCYADEDSSPCKDPHSKDGPFEDARKQLSQLSSDRHLQHIAVAALAPLLASSVPSQASRSPDEVFPAKAAPPAAIETKCLFDQLDRDGNGLITPEELYRGVQEGLIAEAAASDESIREGFDVLMKQEVLRLSAAVHSMRTRTKQVRAQMDRAATECQQLEARLDGFDLSRRRREREVNTAWREVTDAAASVEAKLADVHRREELMEELVAARGQVASACGPHGHSCPEKRQNFLEGPRREARLREAAIGVLSRRCNALEAELRALPAAPVGPPPEVASRHQELLEFSSRTVARLHAQLAEAQAARREETGRLTAELQRRQAAARIVACDEV